MDSQWVTVALVMAIPVAFVAVPVVLEVLFWSRRGTTVR